MVSNSIPDFTMPQAGQGGSPKGQYTYFLLQQCARHQWIMSTKDENIYNIERSCLSLLSWCPDKNERGKLMRSYHDKKKEFKEREIEPLNEEAAVVSSAIDTVGMLVDYLNTALELTEESFGVMI